MPDENQNQSQNQDPASSGSATAALEALASAAVNELRRTRRWNIFFRFTWPLFFAVAVGFAILVVGLGFGGKDKATMPTGKYVALVELNGQIGPGRAASASNVISGLQAAFRSDAQAVILRANSPGGAAVQSAEINSEIDRLRKKYPHKPIYGVIVDMCASGCYYAISATNRIYANPASIVGSIGVLLDGGFGFADAMKKLGIQRRLFHAGAHKDALDPFLPLKASDKRHVQQMLDVVHQQFINAVKRGRGKKLKNDPNLFSGMFWSGATARKLGLVDDFGTTADVARQVVGSDNVVDFTYRPSWLDRFAGRIGASMGDEVISQLQGGSIGIR